MHAGFGVGQHAQTMLNSTQRLQQRLCRVVCLIRSGNVKSACSSLKVALSLHADDSQQRHRQLTCRSMESCCSSAGGVRCCSRRNECVGRGGHVQQPAAV
jgi:hypothetical protein